ncbi:MAG: carbamoyltransferase HypF [Propionibacteriaceae bacterium]|nr:carbamoyltransferase HypF [Propionibacteriaceae bacterium]
MIRRQLTLTGVVQGVGFRPNVVRLAAQFPVTGLCGNDDNSVFIEAQGDAAVVEGFFDAVRTDLPPLATILTWRESDLAVLPDEPAFTIVASRRAVGAITLLPADAAVCPDCLADMNDPANRRYHYPFTTCTNCGPRLSIIRDVPYDRPLTTMADFPMCDACRAEYEDPADRRFHAQPISCFDCGPSLWLEPSGRSCDCAQDDEKGDAQDDGKGDAESPDTSSCAERSGVAGSACVAAPARSCDCAQDDEKGDAQDDEKGGAESLDTSSCAERSGVAGSNERRASFARTIEDARAMLHDGKILAVKGIGGFTLMCDARNPDAVATLRARKHRPGKPLAVMAGSLAAADRIAELDHLTRQLLMGREAPIVLAPMSDGYDLAPQVAPGLDDIGIMLPYAPLHRLLLGPDDILVATSANSSHLPLTYTNDDARRDLSHIVDAFLMHDRGIHVPVEDSVVMATEYGAEPIRRSRGYAPLPVFLGDGKERCVLAVGAELKNTFALTRDGMAFMSAHIGDMGSLETQAAFERSVDQMLTAHRRTPELIVVDKHPGYATHNWGLRQAERLDVPVLEVQHHHAHALSLMAENLTQPLHWFIVLDGTGYGDDGTIWGGEILHLDDTNPLDFDRPWHLPGFGLPGGDSAVRHPWKSAAGLAWEYGVDISSRVAPQMDATIDEWALVQSQLRSGFGVVRTSSAGRLFDAAAAWLGVCKTVTYEAQAAMELEALARRCPHDHHVDCGDVAGIVDLLEDGLSRGTPTPCLARLFHQALTSVLARAVNSALVEPSAVGLTGGVFANRLLSSYLARELERLGHRVVRHQIVPSNDGGLALGQALAGVVYERNE